MTADHTAERVDEPELELGNLPIQITQLVGRDQALEELSSLVWRTRLLTLCGPGGVGKSRLAGALAEALRADFIGGAWWADLTDLDDSADRARLASAVAAALLPGEQLNDPAAAIARHLASPSLLVLDNCEHVAQVAAGLVAELLARVPALRIVVTSRQSQGIPGEHVWRVPGLASAAVELFAQRAAEAGAAVDLSAPATLAAAREICSLLDGLPLAIELAAARTAVLSVEQIAERLRDDTTLLRQTRRAAPGRHRTLEDTLEWSHQLLAPAEQRLFRRLAVFHGNFSLKAAETVCGDELLPPEEILDLLTLLIDQSLVQVVESPSLPRYRLLGTLRRYGLKKLQASGELEAALARHSAHYHGLIPEIRQGLAGPQQVMWVEGLELDHDNLSDVLGRLFDESPQQATELACALWPFYYQRGYYDEARQWFERALAHGDELSPEVLADALLKAGEVTFLQCDYPVASEHLERTLKLVDGSDGDRDRRAEAIARQRLGTIAREQGRYDDARRLHEQSLAIWEALGEAEGVASSQNYLGFVAWLAGDTAGAETACAAALGTFRGTGNVRDTAATLVSLGAAAIYAGDLEPAAERLNEALAISRRIGFQEGVAWSLNELAILARRRRRTAGDATLMLRDALIVHQQLGDRWRMASVLEEIGGWVLARRDGALCVKLLACADALRTRIGAPVPPAEAADRDAALARLRRQLNPAGFESAWTEGSRLGVDQGVALALDAIERFGDDAGGNGAAPEIAPILTPRELAVLELLSQGHTNREIAGALYISPSTAGVHVSNILRKLRAKRRTDAAGRAHALGLLPTPQ